MRKQHGETVLGTFAPVLALLALLLVFSVCARAETTPAGVQPSGRAASGQTATAAPAQSSSPEKPDAASTASTVDESKRSESPTPAPVVAKVMEPSAYYEVTTREGVRTVRFYNVLVEERPVVGDPREGGLVFTVWIGQDKVLEEESYGQHKGWPAAYKDFPRKGLDTLLLPLYDGAIHCCFSYCLLTRLENGSMLMTWVRLGDGYGFTDKGENLIYPSQIVDPGFCYYSVSSAPDCPFCLCFAESPRPTRFMVFDAQGWRIDRMGEFPLYYRTLIDNVESDMNRLRLTDYQGTEAKREEALNRRRAVLLMQKAYYSLMAGEPSERVWVEFERQIPKRYAQVARTIFDDVYSWIHSFNPVDQRVYR